MIASITRFSVVAAIALLAACGGGSGGDSGHPLTGTWFGTMDNLTDTGDYSTLRLEIDEDGEIVAGHVDGIEQNVSATEDKVTDGFHVYMTSDGFPFILRRFAGDKLAFLTLGESVALLQRGASSHPTYDFADAKGTFSGTELTVDASLSPESVLNATAEVAATTRPWSYSNGVGCEYTGTLVVEDEDFGVYTGTFARMAGSGCLTDGFVKHYLSPDKEAAFTAACREFSITAVPEECAFFLSSR